MKPRVEELPTMPWTSMIDIIFQLLIFFMVTLALGTLQQQATAAVKGEMKKDLPKLPPVEKLADAEELKEGFLLHIDQLKEPPFNGGFGAYILDPECPNVDDAKKDPTRSRGPFTLDKAKLVLKQKIESVIFQGEEPPRLFIRAHKETSYGYILDIMTMCDQDSIEVVNFRFAKVRR